MLGVELHSDVKVKYRVSKLSIAIVGWGIVIYRVVNVSYCSLLSRMVIVEWIQVTTYVVMQ